MNERKYPDGLSDAQAAAEYRAGASTIEIAAKYNTTPKQISRMLERVGCARRAPGEARANAVAMGRGKTRTKGTTLTEEHKKAIAAGQAAKWASLTDEERVERGNKSRAEGTFGKDGAARLRSAAQNGSKIAARVCAALINAGFPVDVFPSIQLPGRTIRPACVVASKDCRPVAVLVWGPSHFVSVFGDEKLAAQQQADAAAVEMLREGGFSVLKVEITKKSFTEAHANKVCEAVVQDIPQHKAGCTITVKI